MVADTSNSALTAPAAHSSPAAPITLTLLGADSASACGTDACGCR